MSHPRYARIPVIRALVSRETFCPFRAGFFKIGTVLAADWAVVLTEDEAADGAAVLTEDEAVTGAERVWGEFLQLILLMLPMLCEDNGSMTFLVLIVRTVCLFTAPDRFSGTLSIIERHLQ